MATTDSSLRLKRRIRLCYYTNHTLQTDMQLPTSSSPPSTHVSDTTFPSTTDTCHPLRQKPPSDPTLHTYCSELCSSNVSCQLHSDGPVLSQPPTDRPCIQLTRGTSQVTLRKSQRRGHCFRGTSGITYHARSQVGSATTVDGIVC